MIHPDLVAKQSPISGRGVFAERDFEQGEVLWTQCKNDLVLPTEEALRTLNPKLLPLGWATEDGRFILCHDDARYVNHSCDPNGVTLLDSPTLFVARRRIKAGEEVTEDYGTYFDGLQDFHCKCGVANCRKYISRNHGGKAKFDVWTVKRWFDCLGGA